MTLNNKMLLIASLIFTLISNFIFFNRVDTLATDLVFIGWSLGILGVLARILYKNSKYEGPHYLNWSNRSRHFRE